MRATLVPFYEGLRRDIERFGGRVEKFIGDAVMALFGAPAAHEDDPERAVRAALDISRTIGRLNEERGLDLSVRISVATGEAVIDLRALEEGHGMAAGDITNTGFRIAEAAAVNGILVDESTYRATQQVIEFRGADPVQAKGKASPLLVWEVIAHRGRYGDLDPATPGAPFFGRGEQLQELYAGLQAARDGGRAQLVNVIGVAGIGKSRLVLEFASQLDAGPEVLYWRQGRSLPYGEETPFWALAEIVKAHAGILRTDDPEAAEQKLRRAVRTALTDETEAAWVESRMHALVGLQVGGDDPGRLESFAAWRRFFEALATLRPVVLVFEDIHWADEGLLEFIDHLTAWAAGAPMLIVCTTRPAIFERHPGWGTSHANSTVVTLASLSDDDTSSLVRALLGERIDEGVERELLERAEGNPLYAGEYARMLLDRGFLESEGGVLRIQAGEELPLPESVQAIIAARVDALPPEEKRLLQAAAVVGRVFWLGAAGTLIERPHYVVGERLERLEGKGFIRRDRVSTVGGEAQYSFHHVLVRDIAYGQVPRGLRADDHARAAEWLETLKIDRADLAELVAHHYERALELAAAAGRPTTDLARRTRLALREAGARAATLHAWATAKRLYEDALSTWPDDDERPLVAFEWGKAWFHAEVGGESALEDVLPKLLERGDVERAADALVTVGELRFRQGDRDGAFARFDQAQALLAETPPSPAKAYVLSNVARFHMIELRPDEALRLGREALEMADALGLDEIRSHALNNIGTTRFLLGDERGVDDLAESLRIALARNSPESIRASLNLGNLHSHFGNLEEAFRVEAEGRRASERFGDTTGLQWFAAERLWELYWRGEWDEAVELAAALLADVEAGGPRLNLEPGARLVRSWVEFARDQLDAALADLDLLCALTREADFLQVALPAFATRARVLAAAGRDADARADVDDLLSMWRGQTAGGSYWTVDLAYAAVELGCAADVEAALAEAGGTRWVDAARAVLAGDYERAAELFARIGSRPEEAVARLAAATSLLQARQDGGAQLDQALEFFRERAREPLPARGRAATRRHELEHR